MNLSTVLRINGGLAYWVLASSVFAKTILVCNALIPYWLELTPYFCSPPNRPFSSFINKNSKGKHPILEILQMFRFYLDLFINF